MKRLKRILIFALGLAVAGALLWRLKRQIVPAGAPIGAFLFQSAGGDSVTSPSGERLSYRFRRDPKSESCNTYTWCYTSDLLRGKVIVAEGWCAPEVAQGSVDFPVYWHGERAFTVGFLDGPGSDIPTWFSGDLR